MKYWLFLAAMAGVLTLGGAEQLADSVLVSINGEAINLGEVLKETQGEEAQIQSNAFSAGNTESILALRKKVLEELIDRKLIMAEYRKKPFDVPEQYLESMLDDTARRMGCRGRTEFAAEMRKNNWSIDELRDKLKERLILQMMVNNQQRLAGVVTPKQIRDYYDENPSEFTTPPSVKLVMLQVFKDDKTNLADLKSQLDGNVNLLDEMANKAGSPSGDLGWIDASQLRADLAARINASPRAVIYGPLDLNENSVLFFKVAERRPAHKAAFDQVSNSIEDKLTKDLKNKSYSAYVAKLRAAAIIKYFQ